MHWRRKWQPTSVFLPGESQGRRSLVDCRLWGRTESDTTEAPQQQQIEEKYLIIENELVQGLTLSGKDLSPRGGYEAPR